MSHCMRFLRFFPQSPNVFHAHKTFSFMWKLIFVFQLIYLKTRTKFYLTKQSVIPRGLFGGGGARGGYSRPKHFEIYLIGTNFVFKKFKFYIDKNLAPQTQNAAEAPGHSILISHHKQDRRSTYRLESTTKVSIHFVDKKIFIFASIFEMKNIILSIDPNLFKKTGKSQYL